MPVSKLAPLLTFTIPPTSPVKIDRKTPTARSRAANSVPDVSAGVCRELGAAALFAVSVDAACADVFGGLFAGLFVESV